MNNLNTNTLNINVESVKPIIKKKINSLDQKVLKYNESQDEDIFNEIYNKYLSKFKYMAFKMNNEDIIQELSLVLVNAIKMFKTDTTATFNTFFWACAKNHLGVLNHHNWAKKRAVNNYLLSLDKPIISEEGAEIELGNFIEDPASEIRFEDINFSAFLEANIYPLLHPSEEFTIRKFLEGYSPEEIGKMIHTSTQNIHAKLKRLRTKSELRNLFLNYFNLTEADVAKFKMNRKRRLSQEEIAKLIQSRLQYKPGDTLLNEEVYMN